MTFVTHPTLFSVLFAASALVTVAAQARGHRAQVYVFKPLSTGLLLLLVTSRPSCFSSTYAIAILAGLFFSLVGDVLLMLPSDNFRAGLFAFLLAHVCYAFAFLTDSPFAAPALPFLVCFAAGCFVLPLLWEGIPSRLRAPVVVYVALLLVMTSQATSRALHLHTAPAACASFGAILFLLSDSLLAWNRFRTPFPPAQALIHATYFPAQWLIALSTCAIFPFA